MANLTIYGGSQGSYAAKLPNSLPSTFGKHRVLVWSGDKQSADSLASINVMLAEPMSQVVYAEWVSCSLPGYCFQINQFPNAGRTSKHNGPTSYWRFIGALTNGINNNGSPFPDAQWPPTSLSQLSINVFNPDGTVPTVSGNWMLELDVWFIKDR